MYDPAHKTTHSSSHSLQPWNSHLYPTAQQCTSVREKAKTASNSLKKLYLLNVKKFHFSEIVIFLKSLHIYGQFWHLRNVLKTFRNTQKRLESLAKKLHLFNAPFPPPSFFLVLAQKLPAIYFLPFISQRAVYFPDLLPFISRGPSISHNVPRISRTFISHIIRGRIFPLVYVQGAVYFLVHLLPRGRLFPKRPFISHDFNKQNWGPFIFRAIYFPGHLFPKT